MRLNSEAREQLKAAGISQVGWARRFWRDGKWHGDACGCPDDRCIGHHHDANDECGCLPALLADLPEVKPGQLWADKDQRQDATRFIRVFSIEDGRAVCEAWWDEAGSQSRTTRIRLDRFKVRSNGYRLVESAPGVPAALKENQ